MSRLQSFALVPLNFDPIRTFRGLDRFDKRRARKELWYFVHHFRTDQCVVQTVIRYNMKTVCVTSV